MDTLRKTIPGTYIPLTVSIIAAANVFFWNDMVLIFFKHCKTNIIFDPIIVGEESITSTDLLGYAMDGFPIYGALSDAS